MIYGKISGLTATLSALLLSSCAMYKTMPEQPSNQPEIQSEMQPIETDSLQDNALETQAIHSSEVSTDQSIPESKVKLSIKDDRLIAKLYTDWNDAQQGDLKLHWIAPKNSHCISTVFHIMKYKESRDYSWAYRTLDYTNKGQDLYCSGLWTVEVFYNPTKQIVGKASLNVPDRQ